MSNYGFGEDDGELSEPQTPDSAVAPKFYRDYMDKVSKQLQALQERNDALEQAQRQTQVAEALTAKGFAPQAAGLFTGTPDKLDDWLSANGAALAKADGSAVEQGQVAAGVPQTVVSAEDQAALTAMAAAGTSGTGALSGDDQIAAQLSAAKDPDEYAAIMRQHGSRFF